MMRIFLVLTTLLFACGEGDPIIVNTGSDGGTSAGDAAPMDDAAVSEGPDLSNASKIEAFLDGKTMLMEGEDVPSHPNGFDANLNLGQATQCYQSVEISILGGIWTTRSALGTVNDAPNSGDLGTCDPTQLSTSLEFPSTAILVTNVRGNGECFDLTATYAGFSQEGRGSISADGSTVSLEFYFKDQALGQRCADGDVGDLEGVTVNNMPFTGDAVQVYRVQQ